MNDIMNTSLTVTSLEIAEMVESRHDKVKQSIERLAERNVIQLPPMGITERINGLGLTQKSEHYVFSGEQGKRDSIVVVAQLSPEFTARLVDRWQELEAAASKPMSPAEVLIYQGQLLLAIEQAQARLAEEQQLLIERQEVTEQRLDQIETATDHFTVIGWWRYAQQSGSLPVADAAKMGRKAATFCKQHEVPMGEVPDPRFGVVKTYPKWVLDDLFAQAA